jgi:hypothetical protein
MLSSWSCCSAFLLPVQPKNIININKYPILFFRHSST